MLTVILKILSILGIILLVLLGILLLALLLVLFFPIFYRVKADRQKIQPDTLPENGQEGISSEFATHGDVRAHWLFGLLRMSFMYPEPGIIKVKFLCFTIYKSDKIASVETISDDGETDDFVDNTNTQTSKEQDKVSQPETSRKQSAEDPQDKEIKQEPKEKLQYKTKSICDKIKEIRENIAYYKEILTCDDTKGLLRHALSRLGKIFKSIRPRKLQADIRFGTGAPDTTGYAFGVYGMACSYLTKHVMVTPDFEQAILVGNLYAAGHITVLKILWNGLMIAKDHRLWELKDKLNKKK